MTIDHAKLFRLERDLEQVHGARYGMSKMQRDAALQIRDIQADPRRADPEKDALRIEVLRHEAADLGARLAVSDLEVQALDQLVKACHRYVNDEAAAEATTTTEDQQ